MSKIHKTYTKVEKLEIVSLSLEEGQSVKQLASHYEMMWFTELCQNN